MGQFFSQALAKVSAAFCRARRKARRVAQREREIAVARCAALEARVAALEAKEATRVVSDCSALESLGTDVRALRESLVRSGGA
jgi:hypothetical protein